MNLLLRYFLMFFLFGFSSQICCCQETGEFIVGNKTPPKTTGKKGKEVAVKFIASADCRIKINGTGKGEILAGKPHILSIPPGKIIIEAVNPITGDLFRDTVIIKPNHPIISIPMDEIRRARENASGPANGTGGDKAVIVLSERDKVLAEIFSNLVKVEGGSFSMGNNSGAPDARPEHPVALKPFYISKYEVTQKQWQLLTGNNPSGNANCDDCPVENITHDEAQLFLNKINALSSRKARLPSEAEWEYVAKRGGALQLKSSVWAAANSGKKTQPVGKLAPNELGIHDLFGNVAEWCLDWYDAGYYKNSPSENPKGPMDGREKAVRGGSFADGPNAFHPALRQKQSWFGKSNAIGMRIVLD